MKKNKIITLLILTLPFLSSCRLLADAEFADFLTKISLQAMSSLKISDFLNNTGLFFLLNIGIGVFLFFLSFILFLMQSRDKSFLYHSLSSLTAAVIYSIPLWAYRVDLPPEFWSSAMVTSLFLLIYYQLFREWARIAFYHRTKKWSYIVTSILLSSTLIVTFLSGHFPQLISSPWPVPLLASAVILDSLINSILSFQRKSDRSGIAGILMIVPLAAVAVWAWFSVGYSDFISFSHRIYFALPTLMIPWQLFLSLILTQRRYKKEQDRGKILSKMVEDEEEQKDKLEELILKRDEEIEDIKRIPAYSLECSRRLLENSGDNSVKVPEGWSAFQSLQAEGNEWPALASWSRNNSLLFAENPLDEPLIPLLFLQNTYNDMKHEKPTLFFKVLNDRISTMNQNPESGISATYLYFLEKEILCATAGTVRIYLHKSGSEKVIPIRSEEKPVTFTGGLGIRAHTREDGKPFRIAMEKGDKIILVSCSLTDRELEVSGDIYGQKSLYRVLSNHTSADAESTVKSILKDFDDFDMGNTLDRQIYTAVFQKT
jgi:Stage II sporulation protein E (SpoIIE)